jgi:hypothetical protein
MKTKHIESKTSNGRVKYISSRTSAHVLNRALSCVGGDVVHCAFNMKHFVNIGKLFHEKVFETHIHKYTSAYTPAPQRKQKGASS